MAQCKIFYTALCQNHLVGDKCKYIVALDDLPKWLQQQQKSMNCEKDKIKNLQIWFQEHKEDFSKALWLVTGFP